MPWIPVKRPGDTRERLMFKYDPERELVQIQDKGEKFCFDLLALKEAYEQAQQKDFHKGSMQDGRGCGSIGA